MFTQLRNWFSELLLEEYVISIEDDGKEPKYYPAKLPETPQIGSHVNFKVQNQEFHVVVVKPVYGIGSLFNHRIVLVSKSVQ